MIQSNKGVSSDLIHLVRTADGSEAEDGIKETVLAALFPLRVRVFRAPTIGRPQSGVASVLQKNGSVYHHETRLFLILECV
jgi:hypothetical protein